MDTQGNYHWDPTSILNQVHMPFIAKHADDQLGKLIDVLKKLDEFKDTLVVVTADHASTHAEHFNGVNATTQAATSADHDSNGGHRSPDYGCRPSHAPTTPALKPLNATGNIAFSYQSTAIETWLIDRAGAKKREMRPSWRHCPA